MQFIIAGLVGCALFACQDSASPKATPEAKPVAKTADDCTLFVKKARGTLQNLATAAGVTWTSSMEETTIGDCRADLAAGKRAQLIDCVLTAKDERSVQGCFPRYEDLVAGKRGSAAP